MKQTATLSERNDKSGIFIVTAALSISILATFQSFTYTQAQSQTQDAKDKVTTMMHASGAFDVKLTPQAGDKAGGPPIGRMTVAKQYYGDLDGSGKGEMLSFGSADGSGVYVAIEQVSGTLQGRKGTFALHHTGVMTRRVPNLAITVVPDSGTDELTGITGTMTIKIDNVKHFYEFDYTLPKTP
jgi:hypothetical protein